MNEIRINPLTGRTVLYAPARRARGSDHAAAPKRAPLPAYDAACPFCPGNEAQLAKLIDERPGGNRPWQTRTVENKFPAVTPAPLAIEAGKGLFASTAARGRHEVIIETPRHDRELADAAPQEIAAVLEAYRARYRALAATGDYATILPFRNCGPGAGTSLSHPHSQLIALAEATPALAHRRALAARHLEAKGRCLLCDLLQAERRDGRRVIFETGPILGFVPYAAEMPCEIWLAPAEHVPDFGATDDDTLARLAEALGEALSRIRRLLGDPDTNLALLCDPDPADAAASHWLLRICPRTLTPGGFELGADMTICPALPERDAADLRAAAP